MPSSETLAPADKPRITLRSLVVGEARTARRLLAYWPVWALLGLFILAVLVAYQTPRSYRVAVGSPSDEAYVRNFHTRLSDSTGQYRWSDVYGYVLFPGLGG